MWNPFASKPGSSETHSSINPDQAASLRDYFKMTSGQIPGYEALMGQVTSGENLYGAGAGTAYDNMWGAAQNVGAENLAGQMAQNREKGSPWTSSWANAGNEIMRKHGMDMTGLKAQMDMDRLNKYAQFQQQQQQMGLAGYGQMFGPGYYGGTQDTVVQSDKDSILSTIFPRL